MPDSSATPSSIQETEACTGQSAARSIPELLQRYFDLLYSCDLSLFDSVFHPNAQLQAVVDGSYTCLRACDYAEMLRKRVPPRDEGSPRRDAVISIDQASEHSAAAKVSVLIGKKHYCDYLSLLSIDGQWRIVSKVYCQLAA
jgi:hypothetical protein